MPTRLTITDKQFFRELENGDNYALNTSSFANHLKGSVMNRIKMTANISVNTFLDIEQGNINFYEVSSNNFYLDDDSYNFLDNGFWYGDSIKLTYTRISLPTIQSVTLTANITSISENRLGFEITNTRIVQNDIPPIVDPAPTPDLSNNTYQGEISTNLRIVLNEPSLDLSYRFNLQEQLESLDFESLLNGSESSYLVKEITTNTQGDWSNTNKSLKNGSFNISYNGATSDSYFIPTDTNYNYSLEHYFIIYPYYVEGFALDGTLPDIYKDQNTLRYVSELGFRRGYNNPNTQINGVDDIGLGSVGFYDETFNGFLKRYSVSNYSIENLSSIPLDSLNVAEPNIIKFRVTTDKLTGGFIDNLHNFVIYVSKLPQVEEYTFNNTDKFEDIWGFGSSFGTVTNGTQTLTGLFDNANITIVDNQTIDVEIQTNFDSNYINNTENGDEYIIAFEIGDSTQLIDDSDSVNLLVERNTFDKDINIQGLITTNEFDIRRTPDLTGFTNYNGWIQHGVKVKNNFSVNLDNRAVIESISVGLLAQNGTNTFDIYRYNFDISSIVNVGGVQNINFLDTQNYKLENNSVFNEISLVNTGQTVPNNEDYEICYGLKIPYQDWQLLSGVDTSFYDTSKELNGFNLNSSNYTENGYEVKFFLDINASQDGIETLYRSLSPASQILDVSEDGNDPNQWSGTIETYNLNGDDLSGSVLTNETTCIKATFAYPAPLTNIFGAIRIGEDRHGGNAVDELTNTGGYPSNNRLIPLDGETTLKVTDTGTTIELECKTNLSELANVNYVICAEVFDIDASIVLASYSDGYSNAYDV